MICRQPAGVDGDKLVYLRHSLNALFGGESQQLLKYRGKRARILIRPVVVEFRELEMI